MAAGAIAPESSPGAPLPMPVPSCARICDSGEASQIFTKLSARSSTLTFSNCFDKPNSGLRRLCVFSMPTRM
ncbi:hypothetical protein D9M68_962260 [compost metagenome]